jgi:ribosomal protein L11 methyltransferase
MSRCRTARRRRSRSWSGSRGKPVGTLELTLRVDAAGLEEVLDAVLPALPGGLHVRNDGDAVELAILASPGTPGEEDLRALAGPGLIGLGTRQASDDWRERRLERYEPLIVAGRFLLRPDWAPPGDAPELTEIVLEQSSAFGTGLHPTTQACLAILAELEPAGVFVDVGCGSGVLSIAAAKLGWKPVLAVDIEPTSVASAGRNAQRNGVELGVSRVDVASEPAPAGDTLAANVPPVVHVGLAEHLPRRPSTLVASGFKPDEIPAVAGAWEELHGLEVADEVRANEWSVLVMRG